MIASSSTMIGGAVVASFGVIAFVLGWMVRRGLYPSLDAPDPAERPRAADRWRYRMACGGALLIGAAAGLLLYAVPPERYPEPLFRHAAYELSSRWIGPVFMLLGVTLFAWPILLARLIPAGPRQHFLWDSAAVIGRVDPRPFSRWFGVLVALGAVVVHVAVRSSHVTFAVDGVTWCDNPLSGTERRAWQDVRRVELVQHYVALAGNVVVRPHLRVVFSDEAVAVAGSSAPQPLVIWQKAAAIAAERSGIEAEVVDH